MTQWFLYHSVESGLTMQIAMTNIIFLKYIIMSDTPTYLIFFFFLNFNSIAFDCINFYDQPF